ncbi:hypothetical protein TNCT_313741 [Trichonephila clavata]|uniref:Uncharacterized protein n=1 Tax=Trichonephila clavata TaxID=2740835 RepID=A0A8X6GZS4_TRICU|nr:hypothetical protein TNCT_313741 [Trichonephila clavata]
MNVKGRDWHLGGNILKGEGGAHSKTERCLGKKMQVEFANGGIPYIDHDIGDPFSSSVVSDGQSPTERLQGTFRSSSVWLSVSEDVSGSAIAYSAEGELIPKWFCSA